MTAVTVDGQQPAYRDPGLLVGERVESLLEMMTLRGEGRTIGERLGLPADRRMDGSPTERRGTYSVRVSAT